MKNKTFETFEQNSHKIPAVIASFMAGVALTACTSDGIDTTCGPVTVSERDSGEFTVTVAPTDAGVNHTVKSGPEDTPFEASSVTYDNETVIYAYPEPTAGDITVEASIEGEHNGCAFIIMEK